MNKLDLLVNLKSVLFAVCGRRFEGLYMGDYYSTGYVEETYSFKQIKNNSSVLEDESVEIDEQVFEDLKSKGLTDDEIAVAVLYVHV